MRRQSREIALQILFQNEFAPQISVGDLVAASGENYDQETREYAQDLVAGVVAHKGEIDAQIQASSRHWKLERMTGVDRNVLRIAVYEMKFASNPLKQNIVIDEAVEIARKFGTTDSASFVNGVLDQASKGG